MTPAPRIAIIGTAGRKEDEPLLRPDSFTRMVDAVRQLLPEGPVTLVSGGAAWADHVAVALFLENPARFKLVLELPAEFDLKKQAYTETAPKNGERLYGNDNPGGTSNHWHRKFREKTGRNSFADIAKAIELGADIRIGNGFFARNSDVASADRAIALTFGRGAMLKDSGTADTMGKFLGRGVGVPDFSEQHPSWHVDLNAWQVHSPAVVPKHRLKQPPKTRENTVAARQDPTSDNPAAATPDRSDRTESLAEFISVSVGARPAGGDDAIPAVPSWADAIPADVWPILWAGAGQRLEALRSRIAASEPVTGRGLAVQIQTKTPTPDDVASPDRGGRPQLREIRHLTPAALTLSSYGHTFLSEDGRHRWCPDPETLRTMLDGGAVDLPEALKEVAPGDIEIVVPSLAAPGPEGVAVLNGSFAQRIEAALLAGRVEARDSDHSVVFGDKNRIDLKAAAKEIRGLATKLASPEASLVPFAAIRLEPAGARLDEYYDRPGRPSRELLRKLVDNLAVRQKALRDLRAEKGLASTPQYFGGHIEAGRRIFGVHPFSQTADEIEADVRRSKAWLEQLFAPGNPRAVSTASKGIAVVDPERPIIEWDNRAFVWFLRQLDVMLPVADKDDTPPPAQRTTITQWIDATILRADAGASCVSPALFFERVAEHVLQSPGDVQAAQNAFKAHLNQVLESAVIDTVCNREIAGDIGSLVAGFPRLDPVTVYYHQRSDIENVGLQAEQDSIFAVRGTKDTGVNFNVARFALPVSYPTMSEAIHGGLSSSYTAPTKSLRGRDAMDRSDIEALFEDLAGVDRDTYRADPKAQPLNSRCLPIRDQVTRAYVDSLATRDLETHGSGELEQGRKALAEFISSKTSIASFGWASNTASSAVIERALSGQPMQRTFANALAKYVGADVPVAVPEMPSTNAPLPAVTSFHDGKHEFLSNFFPAKVTYNGLEFPSAENAYQFAKIAAPTKDETARFQRCTAAEAKKAGAAVRISPNWNEVRLGVMEQILRSKFEDPKLRALLSNTGGRALIEGNQWRDNFWGVSPVPHSSNEIADALDNPSRNHLGRLLMRLRDEYAPRKVESQPTQSAENRRSVDGTKYLTWALNKFGDHIGTEFNGPIRISSANPFLSGTPPFVHPTAHEARAEVISWAEHHRDLVNAVPIPKGASVSPDMLQMKNRISELLPEITESWKGVVGAVEKLRAGPGEISSLANVSLDSWMDVFAALNAATHQSVRLIPEDVVTSLAKAIAQTTRPPLITEGVSAVNEGEIVALPDFIQQLSRAQEPSEIGAKLSEWFGMEIAEEHLTILTAGFEQRSARVELNQALARTHLAVDGLERAAVKIRTRFPLAEVVDHTIQAFDPELFARARAELASPQALFQRTDQVTEIMNAAIAPARSVINRHTGQPSPLEAAFLRSQVLETHVARAVQNLMSTTPLVIAGVNVANGKQLTVAGLGGAYADFVSSFIPSSAIRGFEVTFDSSGDLQREALSRWARQALVELAPGGWKSHEDRAIVEAHTGIWAVPENRPAVVYVEPTRESAKTFSAPKANVAQVFENSKERGWTPPDVPISAFENNGPGFSYGEPSEPGIAHG